jgi:energy-coupling factor transporter ATP-binding protein EcfA2
MGMYTELLYDSDPQSVRCELFNITVGKYPKYVVEYAKVLVRNTKEIVDLIEKHGYVQCHGKDYFGSDDYQKYNTYFLNNDKQSMIFITIQEKGASNKNAEVKDFWNDDDDGKEYDGRRFNFIALLTSSHEESTWFKELITSHREAEDTKNKLFLMKTNEFGSIELDAFPMDNVVCDISSNYGKKFVEVHDKVVNSLKEKKSGLYIFHGPSGSGKTSYIKHLTNVVPERRFILVPNTMVASLFSPKMVQNIYTFKNSILVLEDAEICVFKRDGSNNELVSGLLNITDGLLKDLLNISIFVTFNASNIDDLDKALLRKGRLKAMYKFDYLSIADSQFLLDKLGKSKKATEPMTLADIYNVDEEVDLGGEIIESKRSFGFGS